jgi:hypothetical protein
MDQVSIKYTNNFHCKDPPKFTQIWIFGLKTNHLATLFVVHVCAIKAENTCSKCLALSLPAPTFLAGNKTRKHFCFEVLLISAPSASFYATCFPRNFR